MKISTALPLRNNFKSESPPPKPFRSQEKRREKTLDKTLEDATLAALQKALDEEKLLLEGMPPPPVMPLQNTNGPFFSTAAIQGAAISPEILEIFEKGVNSMAHLTISGISETTFFLDTPQFAGAKIIITEFNTAPKAFNIALVGAPEMAALFNEHAPHLIAAFRKSPFNFSVHRLESMIDHPRVERKEDEDEEKQ